MASSIFGARVRKKKPGKPDATTSLGYVRCRDLPRLLPILASELSTRTPEDHEKLLSRIRRALRTERRRAMAADWTYSITRHRDLLRAYQYEQNSLATRKRQCAPPAEPILENFSRHTQNTRTQDPSA